MIHLKAINKHFSVTQAAAHKFSWFKKNKPTRITALENIDLQFRDGEITGLLGLNGAGKSTLMRLIGGILTPTSGDIFVDEFSVAQQAMQARTRLGVLPDNAGLYKRLTARENIRYFGALHSMPEIELETAIENLSECLGMGDIIDRPAAGFSLGERMKTALARAIVHQPQHILLDEPTNGLDVITTRAVRNLLHSLKAQGRCVVFSSHLMYEVSGLCDRIIIIDRGCILADGSLDDILQQAAASDLENAFVSLLAANKPGASL